MATKARRLARSQVAADHPLAMLPCPVCPPTVAPYSPRRCADYAAVAAPSRRGAFGDATRRAVGHKPMTNCPGCGGPMHAHQTCWPCGERYCWDCGTPTGSMLRAFCSSGNCRPGLGGPVEFVSEDARQLEAELARARWDPAAGIAVDED